MCSCQTRTSVFEACGHKSRRHIPCGKARLRASNFLCLGSFMIKCKSEKLRKIKYGLCGHCEAHFRPFRINDPRHVEKYIAYKQANGLGKIDARVIPIDAIFSRFDIRRMHGQSLMRATPPPDSRQPNQENFEQAADPASPDCENAASDWSWSPALAESCVGEIRSADVDIYLFSDELAERAGAKVPGLYRGNDIKETTLYMPCDSVLDFDPVSLMGAPPCMVRITHPGRGYTCAAQAICFCAELGAENCLPCSERNEQMRTLQSRFI